MHLRQRDTLSPAADPGGIRSQQLARLISDVLAHDDVGLLVEGVLAATATLGAAATSIALLDDEPPALRLLAASDERADHLVRHEVAVGQGPSLQTIAEGERTSVGRVGGLDRWPRYATEALELGIRAALGFPLHAQGHDVGALVLYAASPMDLVPDDRAFIQALADIVVLALLQDRAAHLHDDALDLTRTLADHTAIAQASGVIAELRGISVGRATDLLRARARSTGQPLAVLARAVAGRVDDPSSWTGTTPPL